MGKYRFRLSIPSSEYLAHYQGVAQKVVVTLAAGLTVQFPASALRPHVTHNGIQGTFVLHVDENNRLQTLERVGD